MGGIAFDALAEPSRLRVADTVGNEQYELHLESPVSPEPISTDRFTYPVSDAIEVELSGFELPGHVRLHIWNQGGELIEEADVGSGELRFPAGDYSIEFCRALKTYLNVPGPVDVEVNADGAKVRFESSVPVQIGARSPRKRPAGTITTTDDPGDIMQALSCLGDGLLTTTPMRAYPNLRGYPPEIELGETLDIPERIDPGPQPVSFALPRELPYLYEAAPLIYYLNADVRPGSTPRLLVDEDPVYEFDPGSFHEGVKSLLGHVLTLDCVVRSAGPYPIESVEVDRLVEVITDDFSELYRTDRASRLRTYLDVPFKPVAEQRPPWPKTAHIEPGIQNVEAIPHLVSNLTPIRAVSPPRVSGPKARQVALQRFTDSGAPTRAARDVFDGDEAFVDTGSSVSRHDIWVGSDIPISANDFLVDGYRNRLSRPSTDNHTIDVTIVCNEGWMTEEVETVQEYYAASDDLPFEITIHEDLDRASLAEILASETDFLHYVGHATTKGLECTDGYLDIGSISTVGVDTFLLNACQSYKQARELVKGGAIGGIATLSDVTDDQAAVVGRTAARLLNLGYPLQTTLAIARSRSIVGGQYLTVGDPSVMLVTADFVPAMVSVKTTDSGYVLSITTFQSNHAGAGGLYFPWIEGEKKGCLVGKTIGPYEMSSSELVTYLERSNVPVRYDGEFRWAFDLAAELD